MARRIGVTNVPLVGYKHLVRAKESNLGNLIADIMRFSLGTSFGTPFCLVMLYAIDRMVVYFNVDAAFINAGAIRLDEELPSGFITEGDILR